jgi:ATP-binding cassette subfamily C protein CydC
MNADLRRLVRWLRRAQPPRAALARALVAGLVATATNVGMLVTATALLVVSATRPGLRAVAGVLIVIELLAFLRSPIRFNERLSAHRLGFAAVTRWRRWLVVTIGRWSFSTWRSHAAGDLLERSLRDTDELQDLWLRGVLPAASTVATAALADIVIAVLPSHGGWWSYAVLLGLVQILGVAGLVANVSPLIRADRALRTIRGSYRATLVELSAVTPELMLLERGEFAEQRSAQVRHALARAEHAVTRRRRASGAVAPVATVAALVVLLVRHPVTSPTWIVVVALLALATFEALATVRVALDTAVAINGAAERLEDLETTTTTAHQSWPDDNASFVVAPGQRIAVTGPSGSGKSTLLRVLAALDVAQSGSVRVGETAIGDIDEDDLRRHVLYVPAEPGLTRGFAFDVVRLGRASTRDVTGDLAALGIDADPSTKFDELSRGERARVALARALVTAPSILLLDEPTSGLGRDETTAVLALLAAAGASVVVATHDPLVVDWCDEVVELAARTP